MTMVKIRRDGNSSVVTIPTSELNKLNVAVGEYVDIDVDEATGRMIITPMRIEPRTQHTIREASKGIAEEKRGLFERLEAYDRGERD